MHSAPRPVRCPLLIGRDDLLELADRRLEDVLAGHGQFLLLAGQAGIGKTRFLGAITRKAEARGFVTAQGSVAPQDHDVPAASILDLARTMIRIPAFATLGEQLLALDDAVASSEHVGRRRFVTGSVDLILSSITGPTMLSFEDLHWADDVSLEIIAELARRSRDTALLITGDYRTRGSAEGHEPPSLALAPDHPADRRGGAPRPARPRRDGPGHDPAARHRPAGAARRRTRGVRADGRHPAAHRRAARGAQRRGAGRRHRDPRGQRPRDDRGCRHRPDRPAVAGSAGDRARRGGHRPVLRAGCPGRDHGPAAGHDRGSAPGAGRPVRPGRRPASAGCTTSATSCCATRCIGRSPPRSAAAITRERASSVHGWRAPRRSTRPSITSGPVSAGRRSRRPSPGRARPRACRRVARPSSSTDGPWTTCPTTSATWNARRSSRPVPNRPGRSRSMRPPR